MFWTALGRGLFWITWPGIWLVVRLTPPRTRVVVVHDNKTLLVKDWLGNGQWNFPGGGLHRGELPLLGAVRELREETGIVVKASDLQGFGTIHARSSGITSQLICSYVGVPALSIVTLQRFEILEYCWANVKDLENMNTSCATKAVLATFKTRYNLLH